MGERSGAEHQEGEQEMGDIISFVGQKGGTGKSTLARAFAVEALRRESGVVIADLDEAQRTSWDWGAAPRGERA